MKVKPLCALIGALAFAAPVGIAANDEAKTAAAEEAAASDTVTMTIVQAKGGG